MIIVGGWGWVGRGKPQKSYFRIVRNPRGLKEVKTSVDNRLDRF